MDVFFISSFSTSEDSTMPVNADDPTGMFSYYCSIA